MFRIHKLVEAEAQQVGDVNRARNNIARALIEKKGANGRTVMDDYRRLSLRELFEAFCGPVGFDGIFMEAGGTHVSSAFDLITSNIIQREFAGLSDVTSHLIGDRIVTSIPSDLPKETYSGLQALEDGDEVADGDEIKEAKFKGERSFQAPQPTLFGLTVSMHMNMIKFDQMNLFLRRVDQVRDKILVHRELRRLKALCDHADNQRYYPFDDSDRSHRRVALYRTAATAGKWYGRHVTSITNAVGNEAKLQAVMDNFNVRKDEDGKILATTITQAIFPAAKQMAALKMMGFTSFLLGGSDSDHSKVGGGLTAAQILNGMPEPIFSKYLDSVSGAAGTWFIGNIKPALVEQVIHEMTVARAPESHAALFDRNLAGKWKAYYQANITVVGDDELLRCTP